MSVFISYSTKDFEFVDKLSTELVKNRINVWLDKWEMKPGDSLLDKIQSALTESSFLLVVLSKNSVESEWCRKELNSGLMRELNEKQVVVIPILLDDCKVPIFLQEKVYADFRSDFERGMQSLLRPLSSLFNERMGRITNSENITDFAIDWGIRDDYFYFTVDFVNWLPKNKKSILLQFEVDGCENATKRFEEQLKRGLEHLMKESVIEMMYVHPEFENLNILVKSNEIARHRIMIVDKNMDIKFYITIRAVLMGIDDGNDVLINFIDFLKMLRDSRKERVA